MFEIGTVSASDHVLETLTEIARNHESRYSRLDCCGDDRVDLESWSRAIVINRAIDCAGGHLRGFSDAPSLRRCCVANPYDNAKAESFMKTLKQEEVDGRDSRDADEARRAIGAFTEEIYNRQRLHSALDYRPPAEFEANLPPFWLQRSDPKRR